MIYKINSEAVGFIVYALHLGEKLSLGEFAETKEMDVLQVVKLMASEGGFQAEPKDALAFFLFEDRAKAFVNVLQVV
jgi:hypothetical protein